MAIFPNTWFTNVCNFGLQAYWNERFFGFFFPLMLTYLAAS